VSPKNADVIMQINEAFNSGDLERMLAFMHPDFETEVPARFSAEPDTYRGHEGMRRYFDSFHEAMDDIRFHQDDVREAGETVLARVRLTARGRSTAIPVEQRFVQAWTVREGKAVSLRSYETLPEALAAEGIEA
jgi:ketosteroid isomerase-like protein